MLKGLDVGEKMRKLRKEHNDTLKDLAQKIDYDYSNLSKMERGLYTPSIEILNKIIKIYGVSPTYFFGDDFTASEGELLLEQALSPSDLKTKYSFVVDGVEATDEEIEQAIRLIRYFREGEED